MEVYVSKSEAAWMKWIKDVRKFVGHDIDGAQADGYSMDEAYAYFTEGYTPYMYVVNQKRISMGFRPHWVQD